MSDKRVSDLLYQAWGVIANANGGNWNGESKEWQEAAARWRDDWHAFDRVRYCRFIEYNDHEGERWSFWLQLTGNEDELVKLSELMETLDDDEQFALHMDVVEPEHVVDLLCLYADGPGDYNPDHMKVSGTFTCPTDLGDSHGAALYKGGINAFFRFTNLEVVK